MKLKHRDLEISAAMLVDSGAELSLNSFPKMWLLENIEKSAEPLLQDGTDEEYRRLLELYIDIDRELTQRLARRALQHDEPDIHEVGEDFQNYLENGHRTLSAI